MNLLNGNDEWYHLISLQYILEKTFFFFFKEKLLNCMEMIDQG